MVPAHRRRRSIPTVRTAADRNDAHQVVFFQRRHEDDPAESVPAREFLRNCPAGVRAKFASVLQAVAAAPPHRFAGGGYWEAMHGDMAGWFEVRVDGPKRHHFRLFCLIDLEAIGYIKPLLVVVAGLDKPFRTTLTDRDYAWVRALGDEYHARNPRSLA